MSFSYPKKAMLLAAGLGERLRPLTLTLPKPLIPIQDHPLILYNILLLKHFGVREILINLYHLGEKIKESLGDGRKWGISLSYSEEKTLLGTGGGVKAAEDFFEHQPFFLLNADVLIDLDLNTLFEFHQKKGGSATLVVTSSSRRDVKRWVYVGDQNQIVGIQEHSPPAPQSTPYIFTGAQILHPKILNILPQGKSCIVEDAYLPLLKKGMELNAFISDSYWRDLGTFERYEEVQKEFAQAWPYKHLKLEDLISP